MKPDCYSSSSELISAMSAMNTPDDRKEYNGDYLTDDINEVRLAHNKCSIAIGTVDVSEFNTLCNDAIKLLQTPVENERLCETHSLLEHSIEHIKAAVSTFNKTSI